jgi:hypothetical protein
MKALEFVGFTVLLFLGLVALHAIPEFLTNVILGI